MKKGAMLVIGLTGSIAVGKSTCARMFARRGAAVFGADKAVHELMQKGGKAEKKIARLFPEAAGPRGINRRKLAAIVFNDAAKLRKLEAILHPLVFSSCAAFVRHQKRAKAKAVLLEIPLLFETGYDRFCDVTICVTCSKAEQARRAMARSGLSPARLRDILRRQWADKNKRASADFVLKTDKGLKDTNAQVAALWKRIVQDA